MTKKDDATRRIELSVRVDAPPEEVWKALTEADEIRRWFAPEARVEPGEGGTLWLSWGEGMEGAARIRVWDPPRRLVTSPVAPGKPEREAMSEEYTLQAADGGTTILRLVQSGFGPGADFDDEYDATTNGWRTFFRMLQHGVGRHRGQPSRNLTVCRPVKTTRDEAWAIVKGPKGLGAEGRVEDLRVGFRYHLGAGTGDVLEGEVWHLEPSGYLTLTVDGLNDSLLSVFCERCQGAGLVSYVWILNGPAVNQAEDIGRRWTAWLDSLFPAGPSS